MVKTMTVSGWSGIRRVTANIHDVALTLVEMYPDYSFADGVFGDYRVLAKRTDPGLPDKQIRGERPITSILQPQISVFTVTSHFL